MATTITITCPECEKQMKAPAEVLGKKIRCKACGYTFAAREGAEEDTVPPARPAAKAAPAKPGGKQPAGKQAAGKPAGKQAAPAKKDDDEEDASPYTYTEEKLGNRCPNCANALEDEDAVVCLHCGYNTMTRTQARTRKVRHISGFDVFLWLLPGIACVLAVITLLTIDIVYCVFINEWVDQEAWYSFVGSLGMKIWLVVPTLFFMYLATRFAIKRLIFENRPPEVEEK
jgi:hypothetical protein